jgi:aspartyl-tRNA(Asn)/glutamyl-tRNA(Gln) amidotransferase subunit C
MSDAKTSIQIDHLANLSRLNFDPETSEHARRDLEKIITMIDAMQAVDTEGVEPLSHPLDSSQRPAQRHRDRNRATRKISEERSEHRRRLLPRTPGDRLMAKPNHVTRHEHRAGRRPNLKPRTDSRAPEEFARGHTKLLHLSC